LFTSPCHPASKSNEKYYEISMISKWRISGTVEYPDAFTKWKGAERRGGSCGDAKELIWLLEHPPLCRY
jgi:hypothetical protein